MTTTVLLLGLKASVVEEVRAGLDIPNLEIRSGTSIEDLRETLAQLPVDHVVMGAGLDLEQRLGIVREIFETSDRTTVHMKDRASGPEGFLPFVQGVLGGLNRA
ncbi:hypothetical protein H0264_11085 [Nocardia huaxiensis]|uniref:Uncharacterized protein n=1 Tax=Nocardia huaxiensis TaxID=2755382 RepID=A0A7D6VLU4_9NOCA|nr:hypothetical protein [Nocardia huaxiensis]QLY32716.1 hypothetical protein H0264_11085 [Nocardia huaxiensis]